MERLVLSKEEMMIEINCSKLSKLKTPYEETHGEFTLTFLNDQVKIKHPRGNSICRFYKGNIRVAKKHFNCYDNFVNNGNQTINLHLDKLKQILDKDFEAKERKKIEKNVSNVTDLMLLGYIENHLSGLVFTKSIYLLCYQFHFESLNYTHITFNWKNLKDKNNQNVDELICNFSFGEYNKYGTVKFSEFVKIVPELLHIQQTLEETKKLIASIRQQKLSVVEIFTK